MLRLFITGRDVIFEQEIGKETKEEFINKIRKDEYFNMSDFSKFTDYEINKHIVSDENGKSLGYLGFSTKFDINNKREK